MRSGSPIITGMFIGSLMHVVIAGLLYEERIIEMEHLRETPGELFEDIFGFHVLQVLLVLLCFALQDILVFFDASL